MKADGLVLELCVFVYIAGPWGIHIYLTSVGQPRGSRAQRVAKGERPEGLLLHHV